MTRKKKKILTIVGICLAVYFIAVFFGVSAVVTRMAPEKLAEFLGRPVAVEQIRVNPLTLSVSVYGLNIKDKNGTDPFVRFEKLYVNAQSWSLVRRGLVLKRVLLEKPQIHVSRLSGATFNFSDLMAEKPGEKPAEPDQSSEPFRFAVSDIHIIEGTVVYRDEPFDETHTIFPINWRVPFISNFISDQDQFSEPAFTCEVDGAKVSLAVRTKPFKDTMETVVDLALSGVSIPRYTAYAPADRLGFDVNQGTLDITAQLAFRKDQNNSVIRAQGQVVLENLDMTDEAGADLFSLPRLSVAVLPSVVTENRLHIGEIQIQSPSLNVVRQADGAINLTGLVKSGEAPSPDAGSTPQADTSEEKALAPDAENNPLVAGGQPDSAAQAPAPEQPTEVAAPEQPAAAAAVEADAENGFVVDMDRLVLSGGTVKFIDFAVADPGAGPVENTINDLNVTVASFSTAPEKQSLFDVSATINNKAPVSVKGDMTISPLAVESDASLSDVSLAWGQPYLPQNMHLEITGGQAKTGGHLSLSTTKDGQIAATVTGNAEVRGFASVDPVKAEPFLQWSDFTVDGIKVSTVPLRVDVDTIAFKSLKNHMVVFEDGVTNVAKIFGQEEAPAEAPAEAQGETPESIPAPEKTATPDGAETVTPIRIGRFLMKNTEFRFTDRSVDPHYATRLTLTDLKVTGLTSEDFKAAEVKASGNVDGYAPVDISGTINPLARDLFVNLDVKVANMEMAPFSSYTGKYVGRAVEKGKLNLDLQYDIQHRELKANNHIVTDQFTLGKSVESPDAVNLPVGLAVSLLTDRKGIIDVNLPVSGRTDDPEFRVTRIVFKALANLIAKAATSPFSLVGALVGGGEETGFIEFEPGRAELDKTGMDKLDAVRTLMADRPALKLEILGYADADADRKGLAGVALERRIKAPALAKLVKKGEAPDSATLASVVLAPEQYERALRNLYEKEVEEKPVPGVTVKKADDPTLTLEEMETALVDRMAAAITDADLGMLAGERAEQVKDYLLADQTLAPERVFLKVPDNPLKPAGGNYKSSRVELGIQ